MLLNLKKKVIQNKNIVRCGENAYIKNIGKPKFKTGEKEMEKIDKTIKDQLQFDEDEHEKQKILRRKADENN